MWLEIGAVDNGHGAAYSRMAIGDPIEEAPLLPDGASVEELARLAPQSADELYNEFDFTEPSTADTDPVTVSYGERVSSTEAVGFWRIETSLRSTSASTDRVSV
ncbi:MAG: hypothetical protein HYX27_21505 [Acidobacteria bacterium]|nr:hypothetical protein [Acidobacteriota bacterium]